MRIHTLLTILATTYTFTLPTIADTWSFKAESHDKQFNFGSTKVILITDARKSRQNPDFILKVFRDGKLQAQYRGISFEDLVASPNNKYFLGLSNSGIPGTAAVLFDNRGRLLFVANHGLAEFDYCERSVTIQRVWYDHEHPEIHFEMNEQDGGIKRIMLRDCKGQKIDLLQTILSAYSVSFQRMHAETAPLPQLNR